MRVAGLIAALAFVACASGADWTEWRGPHRDGVLIAEPKSWPEKLNVKWKIVVGEGHASPILVGSTIYDFARADNQETLYAINLADGRVKWKQQYAATAKVSPAANGHGPGPKSTPLYANGKIYTLGLSGVLSCWDAETGKLAWRKDSKEFKEPNPIFGASVSPIVDRGMLIVHLGGDKSGALKAFDPATGREIWSWAGDGPSYASPIVVELAGARQVVTQTQSNIVAINESDGKLLWKIPFTTAYEQNIVTPVLYKDTLIFSGLDKGVFAVRLGKTIWENKDASMYMNSPVLSSDTLFGFSHLKKGQLFAMDAATGKTLWLGPPRGGDNAALLASSSTLVALNNDGQLTIAHASPKGYEQVREYTVAESPTWAHPLVLPDGVLIKDLKSLTRWGI